MTRPRVALVQRYVPAYRVPFLHGLHDRLAAQGVDFRVVHGQPPEAGGAARRFEPTTLPFSIEVQPRYVDVGATHLVWEPVLRATARCGLVIVEQAASRLANYLLLARQAAGGPRVAFMGHGRNLREDDRSRLGEALKRWATRRPHWFFAYNAHAAAIVEDLGFPPERITDFRNSVDTRALVDARSRLRPEDLAEVRRAHGLPDRHVVAFVGGMYGLKRIPFLLESLEHLRGLLPDAAAILVGSGQDDHLVARAAEQHPWLHWVGPLRGDEKVPLLATADLFVLPGAVGLAVLDAFALELPLVTVAGAGHGPELDYLADGRNGVVLPEGTEPAEYARAVADLLEDRERLERLRAGCREAQGAYGIEQMVDRFADGVLRALATD